MAVPVATFQSHCDGFVVRALARRQAPVELEVLTAPTPARSDESLWLVPMLL